MNLLLVRLINHYKIAPSWQIYIVGFFLFCWQLNLDYQSFIDYMNGIMPYDNPWQSYLFFAICLAYTVALIFTLFLHYFSVWIWLVYTVCLVYVVRHLPLDLITPPLWKTKHLYAFLDAVYIVHGSYFFSKGLNCCVSICYPYYLFAKSKVRLWLKVR